MTENVNMENKHELVTMLKAVANVQRLTIIEALIGGEKNVRELESLITLSQSALSQHLSRLRRDNIVRTRRQAQLIYYSLTNDNVISLMKYLDELPPRTGGFQ